MKFSKYLILSAGLLGLVAANEASSLTEASSHSRVITDQKAASEVDKERAKHLNSIHDPHPDAELPELPPDYPHVGFFDPNFKIENPHSSSAMEIFAQGHASMIQKAKDRAFEKKKLKEKEKVTVPSSLFQMAEKPVMHDVHRHTPSSLVEESFFQNNDAKTSKSIQNSK